MIHVYVTFPVYGKDEQLAKQTIYDLLKKHFPKIKFKIDSSIEIQKKNKNSEIKSIHFERKLNG